MQSWVNSPSTVVKYGIALCRSCCLGPEGLFVRFLLSVDGLPLSVVPRGLISGVHCFGQGLPGVVVSSVSLLAFLWGFVGAPVLVGRVL
jgi:hypothetical protein